MAPKILHASVSLFGRLPAAIAELERVNGGRIGVAVLDTGTGERSGYRQNERFPMCSTFKFLLVSAVLRRLERHEESLGRAVKIPARPLAYNSPLTEPHTGSTMTISDLCHATLTRRSLSDIVRPYLAGEVGCEAIILEKKLVR